VVDQGFDRHPGEQRIPSGKNQRLPQPPDSAVAIAEGVDVFQHVVDGGALDERVRLAGLAPVQKLLHEGGDLFRRSAAVHHHAVAAHDGHADRAELARLPDERIGQVRVGQQQVAHRPGIIAGHFVVGAPGVLHLLDVLGRSPDRLAVDDIGDLAQGEPVAFDGGGGMNREDAAQPAQVQQVAGLLLADLDALQQGVDVADLFVPAGIVRVELFQRRHGRASGVGARISSMVGLFIGTIVKAHHSDL
jgi:hypothetical protein